jgi:hypothetical protein
MVPMVRVSTSTIDLEWCCSVLHWRKDRVMGLFTFKHVLVDNCVVVVALIFSCSWGKATDNSCHAYNQPVATPDECGCGRQCITESL